MLFAMSAIVQLFILVAIGVAIARMLRRRQSHDGTSSLRRFFVYGLLAGSVAIGAGGVWGLIARALEPPAIASDGNTALALSLSFALVGLPAAALLFRSTLGRLAADPAESESAGWRFYITGMTAFSLLGLMLSSFAVAAGVVGLDEPSGDDVAWLMVTAAVWALHWMPAVRRYHPPSGIHLFMGTLLGFAAVAGSVTALTARAFDAFYDSLFTTELIAGDFGDIALRSLIALGIGAGAWVWHWFLPDRSRWSETVWHTWVLIGGVLTGVLAVLGAVGSVAVAGLIWTLGDPGGDPAATFFDFVPSAMAVGLVGWAAAAYHYRMHATQVTARTEAARAYEYLLAAVGLLATLIGTTTLLVAFFGTIAGPVVAGEESSINILLSAVVAVAMGGPLWVNFWRRIERHAAADPTAELASASRRSYVLAVLGIAGIVGMVSTISVIFLLLEDLLEATLGSSTLYDMRVPLALMMTAGSAAWYHWSVFRSDQQLRPAPIAVPKHVVLLATGNNGAFLGQLESAVGGRVDRWEMLGTAVPGGVDVAAVAAAISSAPGDDVLVMMRPDGEPFVVSYRTV